MRSEVTDGITTGRVNRRADPEGVAKSLRSHCRSTVPGSRVQKRHIQKGNLGPGNETTEKGGEKVPTKSNNTGGRGGKRPGAGRKPKGVAEKAANGNPGGRKLTVLDIPEVEGMEMPKPDEILSAKQKDGTTLKAAEIYERVWKWLDRIKATAYVSPQMIEQYAMCKARWLQCEEMTNELGFLSRHPTTNKPITSPFINIGINYLNQATRQWDAIMQTIKENCSVDFSGANPNDDLEKILHQRKGF